MNRILSILILIVGVITGLQAQDLPSKATDTNPLMNGETIPAARLVDLDGNEVEIMEMVSSRPAMIIFYRGSWCPYCNRQLAGLQEVEPKLQEMGFQVIAISPDTPDKMMESVEKSDLTYTVLSDAKIDFMRKMGLAFIDHKNRTLPVPAVYLVDKEGLIHFSYVNPNYKVRPHPELLLKAAELMVGG